MSLKIAITSVNVLERLIGGDTEIELEIRQAVAENFARRHIKSLVKEAQENTFVQEMDKLFFEVEEKRGMWGSTDRNKVLKGDIKTKISALVKSEADNVLRDMVRDIINTGGYKEKLEMLVAQQADIIAREWTQKEIGERIQRAADRIIKEKLGIK